MGPRLRVWSREIVEGLERSQVAKALEAGSIVVVDEPIEEGAVAYDHRDAAGFIRLNALRLRTLGQRKRKLGL